MKIEAGKYYRTRSGDVVGPMRRSFSQYEPWYSDLHRWNEDGGTFSSGAEHGLDLISEVYVSDTPPADTPATPSDDTVVTFNFLQMAREGKKWMSGSIGFWIGDEMRTAHYDVRIGGGEGKAWPSDVPNPWRDKRGLPAPEPETKTLRDEFAMRLMDRGAFAVGYIDEAEQLYRAADAMMEARKK